VSIQLQFVKGSGVGSRLIAWWAMGYAGFSHVDAVLPDGSLLGARSDAIGGKPPGVQIRPAGYEAWSRRCVVTISSDQQQAARWETFLRSQIDSGYDKADILGLILGIPLASPGHWICSALQFRALQVIGKVPDMAITPQQVPPNMLYFGVLMNGGIHAQAPT